jgi:ribosomal protein S17
MEKRNLRKERIGIVTSNKMMKSIVVSEVKKVKHPMYGKFVLKTKKVRCTRRTKRLQRRRHCKDHGNKTLE